MTKETFEKCSALVGKYESRQRARHSFGVYEEACRVCDMMKITGKERDDIATAAILHDIAHDLPTGDQLEIMDREKIPYGDIVNYPTVIHARAGAALAKREFPGLSDESRSMIECHTTGRKGMTVGEKIVCLCDFTEPGREYAGCRAVREYFYSKAEKITGTEQYVKLIDSSLKMAFGMTLGHLKKKGYPIHPVTAEVYDDLCSE